MKQKSDKKTLEYLMGLMNSLPVKLFRLVKEFKESFVIIRRRAQELLTDVEGLTSRIDMMATIVEELCDVASAAMTVGPMMKIMEKDEEKEE